MKCPDFVAHRGYPLRYPENSLVGLRAALEAGASWVELDVQLSREGTPHLHHDRDLRRVSGREGALAELDDSALCGYHAAEASRLGPAFLDEPLATLADFACLLQEWPRARAFVELKRVSIEHFGARRVYAEVQRALAPVRARCVPISFDAEVLTVAREEGEPEVGLVLESWDARESDDVARLRPEYLLCNTLKLPPDARLDDERLVVYELSDVASARAVAARGARLIETFAIAELLAAREVIAGDAE